MIPGQPAAPQGLLLAKTFKTASSTAAAVTMRLALRVGQRRRQAVGGRGGGVCQHAYMHEQSLNNVFASSPKESSFLWTTIRHPVQRAVSAYGYYVVTILGIPPSPYTLISYLEATKDQMLQQLRMDRAPIQEVFGILMAPQTGNHLRHTSNASPQILGKVRERENPHHESIQDLIQTTLNNYNLIATSERFDECIILLMIMLGLIPNGESSMNDDPVEDSLLADAVVLSSKVASRSSSILAAETTANHHHLSSTKNEWTENWLQAGKQSNALARMERFESAVFGLLPPTPRYGLRGSISNWPCLPVDGGQDGVSKLLQDPTVQAYIQTNYTRDNLDFLLHDYANASLNATIAAVVVGGRMRVDRLVAQLRQLQTQAVTACYSSAGFPCSMNGQRRLDNSRDCYFRDMGCGYKCVDRLFPIVPAKDGD